MSERYFTENKTHAWYSVLADITKNINNSVNRSIGMPPSKVTPEKSQLIRERLYGLPDKIQPCKFSIGDNVRIPKFKNIHAKGYTQSKYIPVFVLFYLYFQIGPTLYIK